MKNLTSNAVLACSHCFSLQRQVQNGADKAPGSVCCPSRDCDLQVCSSKGSVEQCSSSSDRKNQVFHLVFPLTPVPGTGEGWQSGPDRSGGGVHSRPVYSDEVSTDSGCCYVQGGPDTGRLQPLRVQYSDLHCPCGPPEPCFKTPLSSLVLQLACGRQGTAAAGSSDSGCTWTSGP